jgi:hypothetical protein
VVQPGRMHLQSAGDFSQSLFSGGLRVEQEQKLSPGLETLGVAVGPQAGG